MDPAPHRSNDPIPPLIALGLIAILVVAWGFAGRMGCTP